MVLAPSLWRWSRMVIYMGKLLVVRVEKIELVDGNKSNEEVEDLRMKV